MQYRHIGNNYRKSLEVLDEHFPVSYLGPCHLIMLTVAISLGRSSEQASHSSEREWLQAGQWHGPCYAPRIDDDRI